jgi:hypothetical protein
MAMTTYLYDLHLLGWHSFQQLCLTISREILGQTVKSFLDTNDGGRDGAFTGTWDRHGAESITGEFVIQCKHTSKKDALFALSQLTEELPKIEKLVNDKRCDCYVLLTNAGVSAKVEGEIVDKLKSLGVKYVSVYGSTWICDQIHENRKLRTSVPRLYGLGDLSQILDERGYSQARALLANLRDDLSKIVITDAYKKASEALSKHGFVMLIGEPAAGKTTIASLLAMSALDQWGALTLKIDTPVKVIEHWNSDTPSQFVWVDDAFGVTQYESRLVQDWNHILPQVRTMLSQGIKIVMTSRNYIYNSARNELKEGAFPLFKESQVVIDVHNLKSEEKKQILYNHLKLGTQSREFKSRIKPYLENASDNKRFIPETARRLADPVFTKDLYLSEYSISTYIEKQETFLQEVIQGLDKHSKAALALIYMRNDKLQSPVAPTSIENGAIERLGSSTSQVIDALTALNGSLVQFVQFDDEPIWRFKHPTISDAYAAKLIENPELLEIYILGTEPEKLIDQITCGDVGLEKAVVIPKSYFQEITTKLDELREAKSFKSKHLSEWQARRQVLFFLSRRCSATFLKLYLDEHPTILKEIVKPGLSLPYSAEVSLVKKLHKADMLQEETRKLFVENVSKYAIDGEDLYCLEDEELKEIFTFEEFNEVKEKAQSELVPRLSDLRYDLQSEFDHDDDPDDHMEDYREKLNILKNAFENDSAVQEVVDTEMRKIKTWVSKNPQDTTKTRPQRSLTNITTEPEFVSTRSIFDDIDE